jgi:hypothetical protein
MDYLRRSVENQLTEIYKDYQHESSSGKKKNKDTSADGDLKPISKRPHPVYKYSKKGKADLHEAVILAGLPVFLKYENGDIKIVEKIEETARVLVPPNPEEYPYEPYEFSSMEEVKEFVKAAIEASIGSLYLRAKQYVKQYNDQDQSKVILIASDIISSYFQDKFSTTHYVGVVGDNDSGKSSLGITFEATAYRPLYMTDPSAANIFRCLGTIEPGQCTIILDEADKIDSLLK